MGLLIAAKFYNVRSLPDKGLRGLRQARFPAMNELLPPLSSSRRVAFDCVALECKQCCDPPCRL
jgi:hypothetical protein